MPLMWLGCQKFRILNIFVTIDIQSNSSCLHFQTEKHDFIFQYPKLETGEGWELR